MHRVGLVSLLAVVCLVVPSVAQAQVHFDDSPSKKEYGLPLDRARGEAGGRGASTSGDAGTRRGESGDSAATARGNRSAEARRRALRRARDRAARSDGGRELFGQGISPDGQPASGTVAAQAGSTSPLLWSAIAAAAVLIGGLVVLLLRRRRTRRSG